MRSSPLISICLPTYNGQKYLPRAIESALQQDLGDFQLLISDDCSSDGSAEIIAEYARADKRIKWWRNEGRLGLFGNYNKCLQLADTPYIKPFAQDDFWDADLLTGLAEALRTRSNVALATARRLLVDEAGELYPAQLQPLDMRDLLDIRDVYPAKLVMKACLGSTMLNLIGEPCAVMFRKASVGTGFREDFRHCGDLEYWLRILKDGNLSMAFDTSAYFRRHQAATTVTNIKQLWSITDILLMGEATADILRQMNISKEKFIKHNLAESVRNLPEELARFDTERAADDDLRPEDLSIMRKAFLFAISMVNEVEDKLHSGSGMFAALHANEYKIKGLERTVQELLNSKSWRITRPLREVNKLLAPESSEDWQENPSSSPDLPMERQLSYLQYLEEQKSRILTSRSWRFTQFLRTEPRDELELKRVPASAKKPEERDPSKTFSPIDPKVHWDETRERSKSSYDAILAVHTANRSGAPMLGLSLLKKFIEQKLNILVVLKEGGELEDEFSALTDTMSLAGVEKKGITLDREIIRLENEGLLKPQTITFLNSAEWHDLSYVFAHHKLKIVNLVHEFMSNYSNSNREALFAASDSNVFSSKASYLNAVACCKLKQASYVIPQGLLNPDFGKLSPAAGKEHLRQAYGISPSQFVVLSCGSTDQRKGIDIFVQVARTILQDRKNTRDIHFVWIGGDYLQNYDPLWWARQDASLLGIESHLHFIPTQKDTEPLFVGADLFLLTSRQDPFPCVVHEAMAAGTPVIAFAGSGGAEEVLSHGGGKVVPYLDTGAMADAVLNYFRYPAKRKADSQAAPGVISAHYNMDDYASNLLELAGLSELAELRQDIKPALVPAKKRLLRPLEAITAPKQPAAAAPPPREASENKLELISKTSTASISAYKHTLAIGAIMRNEAPYLREWIEFHRLVGVEKFLLFDNLSNDNSREVLEPYERAGIVELHSWPIPVKGRSDFLNMQCGAYRRIIDLCADEVKWVAFIDIDEFLVPVKQRQVLDLLADYEDAGGVSVNWINFGTAGVERLPENKLLIESLCRRAELDDPANKYVKTISRPDRIRRCVDPHSMIYAAGFEQVNTDNKAISGSLSPYLCSDLLRINHYWTRDEEYFKTTKMKAVAQRQDEAVLAEMDRRYRDFNAVEDRLIEKFIPELKQKLAMEATGDSSDGSQLRAAARTSRAGARVGS